MRIEAAMARFRAEFKPLIRGCVNRSFDKQRYELKDTIPRFLELAGMLQIAVSSDDKDRTRIHLTILGDKAQVGRNGRVCGITDACRFQAAFDIINDLLVNWPELHHDLQRLDEGRLAALARDVLLEVFRVDNQLFYDGNAVLPDEILENIGNILIRASLPKSS